MMGINVDRVIVSTFFIGSALAGAAGVMFGLRLSADLPLHGLPRRPQGRSPPRSSAGIGSIPGAMVGGLLVGLRRGVLAGLRPIDLVQT